MTEEKFRKIVTEHKGNYRPWDEDCGFRHAAWWDAYGDLTECHIAYGRCLESLDENEENQLYLRQNWIYWQPGRDDATRSCHVSNRSGAEERES